MSPERERVYPGATVLITHPPENGSTSEYQRRNGQTGS